MKKITLLLLFNLIVISSFSQTIYYEDFRYENEDRGFTVQKVALGGQDATEIGKRVSDIVDAGDSSPIFDESSRPGTRVPNGTTRDQKTISFKNVSEPVADTFLNHEIEAWALMTSQNLSSANVPTVSFWTQQRFVIGGGATLTIWVSEDYVHGNLPSTATWTNETGNITGSIATSDISDQVYVHGQLDLSDYTGSSVTVAFKVVTDGSAYNAGVSQHGTFYISDVRFDATPQDVANGAFSALNTSASGQPNIFNTPSASISESNFSNTSKWADVLTTTTSVPRLASGALIPVEEGYKFEVSEIYNPILVTEVRFKLVNGHSTKGAPDDSTWKVQASNNDSNWVDVSAPIVAQSSVHGVETAVSLTASEPYRYYRFVLAGSWTPNQAYTALQQLDFTVDDSSLSIEDNVLNKSIAVYPNPANSILNINKLDASINVKSVSFVSVVGKVVYSNTSIKPINVSAFSKGLYLLRIESQKGGVTTRKVIVN
ncbi:T9SS type A sorting domain-containing protein [Snuella sedimenti]|uniref:T9SS type A sorting domain-containing protein n=1 Tax=Snuella sedimenti TaxID=2798802 RepID=A0A8J7LT99_9FLAO|nr:T9SS type A sorting domain-containing protein [Snuella sedimenti]MBJ6368076.1 T9SS type A sorting domain-containing protein [Snuella sedimenti]